MHNEAKDIGTIIDSAKKYATEVVVYDYISNNNTTHSKERRNK